MTKMTITMEKVITSLVEYKIKRCFYGHLHSFATKSAFEGERDGIKFSLISGDHLEFLPKLIEKQP